MLALAFFGRFKLTEINYAFLLHPAGNKEPKEAILNWFFVKLLVEKMTHLLSWVLSLCLNGSEVRVKWFNQQKTLP